MNCQTRPQPRSFHFIFSTILLAAIVACRTAHAQTETAISYGISYAGFISDSSGNLYGVTLLGGSQNCGQLDGCGTVIELSPAGGATWAANVLYSFQGLSDGFAPYGGVVFDAAGNLYGTTQVGGNGGGGTVFKLYPNGTGTWNLTTLYSFVAPNDALYPNSTLIFDHAGNLYGTAAGGGKYGKGAVFELSPASHGPWKETILHSFGASSSDGVAPNGPLAIDPQGNLYGTTVNGGPANLGIAYELSRHGAGWIETLVHTFTGTEGGGQPSAGMIFDAAHNLYGTTFNGGAHGYGTVFRLTRVNQNGQIGWKDVTLYSFTNGTDGADPAAPLVFDAHGNLYGSTDGGFPAGSTNSTGCGQVFELSVGSNGLWSIAALYPVPGFLQPNGNLVLDSAGDIFGTAVDNQNFSYGEAYEITP